MGSVYIECECVKSVRSGEGGGGQVLKGLMCGVLNIETLSVAGYLLTL